MRKTFVAVVAGASSLLTFASVDASAAKDRGLAPGGYDALYQWCRQTIIRQHGWSDPKPGQPHRIVMPAMEGTLMINDCIRSHGKIH
jgi:hypothetical protein